MNLGTASWFETAFQASSPRGEQEKDFYRLPWTTAPTSTDPCALVELDLRGLKCPMPVLRTRKALRRLTAGARLVVACTDPLAGLDIPNLVREEGDTLERQTREGDVARFWIRRGPAT